MRAKLAALGRFHASGGNYIRQTDFKHLKQKNYGKRSNCN
nr:MAG TPA: hypothetical protein [Caudoviricetes sp.]